MSDTLMTREVAPVWRVGRRRYLSRTSAVRALARELIMEHCYCESDDGYGTPFTCKHHQPDRYSDLLERLTRYVARQLRREKERTNNA